jgi:hypothetical protein
MNQPQVEKYNSTKEIQLKTYQPTLMIPSHISAELDQEISDLSFDCFKFHQRHSQEILPFLLKYLFDRYNLFTGLNIE